MSGVNYTTTEKGISADGKGAEKKKRKTGNHRLNYQIRYPNVCELD